MHKVIAFVLGAALLAPVISFADTTIVMPHPTCSMTTSPAVVKMGQPVTISWQSTGGSVTLQSAQLTPSMQNVPANGSITYVPHSVFAFFTIVVHGGPAGTSVCHASVSANR